MRRRGLLKVDNLSSFFYKARILKLKARINCTLKGISRVTLRETCLFIRRPVYMKAGAPT